MINDFNRYEMYHQFAKLMTGEYMAKEIVHRLCAAILEQNRLNGSKSYSLAKIERLEAQLKETETMASRPKIKRRTKAEMAAMEPTRIITDMLRTEFKRAKAALDKAKPAKPAKPKSS